MTYLEVLAEYYPGVGATYPGDSDIYSKIIWDSVVISKSDLDEKKIESAKATKINELSLYAGQLVCAGFECYTLGYARWYDGNVEDQLNLAGATVAAQTLGSFHYPSRSIQTRIKEYIPHTHAQMLELTAVGANFKLGILSRFNQLKMHVLSLNNIESIEAVTWETVI